jgi:hypothetical protein
MKLYVHIVFEPSAKQTPSLLFMLREECPYSVKKTSNLRINLMLRKQ